MNKRILFDTNIYELIAIHTKEEQLKSMKQQLVVYGADLIRKELRDIPKNIKIDNSGKSKNLRIELLGLYDFLVGKHQQIITEQMEEVANKYFNTYKILGGAVGKSEILNDFKIIACASMCNLDIVVSEDFRTMFSASAKKSYEIVNAIYGFRAPKFIDFKELLKSFGGVKLD